MSQNAVALGLAASEDRVRVPAGSCLVLGSQQLSTERGLPVAVEQAQGTAGGHWLPFSLRQLLA